METKPETLSTEQVDLISKKLKEIPLDVQLNGEFLPMTSSTPINILIIDSEEKNKQEISAKTQQPNKTANVAKKDISSKESAQNKSTKSVSKPNESKPPPSQNTTSKPPSSQNTTSKPPPQIKETKTPQNQPSSNKPKDSQDPSKGLDDWLDSLLS